MTAPLAALAERFQFNHQLLGATTADLPADAWAKAPDGGGNTGQWILGHLVASRRFLLRMAGAEVPSEAWEEKFGRGAKPQPGDEYPAVAELTARFHEAGGQLLECLGSLTDADAGREVQTPFPDGSNTLGGAAHFLYMHEVYHLGQLGYIRRTVGLPGFA